MTSSNNHAVVPALTAPLLAAALLSCSPAGSDQPRPVDPSNRDPAPAKTARNPKGVPEGLLQAKHELRLGTRCGRDCAYVQSGESLASLQLSPSGRAEARDEGNLLETFGSVAGDTEHLTTWTRAWVGSWKQNADQSLAIELAPAAAECQSDGPEGKADSPCEPTKLELGCALQTVTLRVDELSTARALVCATTAQSPLRTATRLPWVFGVEKPLLAVDFGRAINPRRAYGLVTPAEKQAVSP
ncbi:MAG: hypothetical protein JRI68_25135 [Deltaproteobacteria bacterium]|nr:hypothetical protein [Deltaproteobacteria bacterium]